VITVIGSINLDLVADVERLPAPGETVPGSGFRMTAGGKGANQALAAARAGAHVRMVGAVGKDHFADAALECLRACGIDLSGVREAHAVTGTALILVGEGGENVIAVVPGANGTVLPGDLMAADLREGEFLLLQNEIPLSTIRRALEAARKSGTLSLYNAAPYSAKAAPLLEHADLVILNETECDHYAAALGLEGHDRDEKMRRFVARTGRTVVLTLGADGAIAVTPEGRIGAPALPVSPVDTVGAGDTFCGYLAAGLASGLGLHEALMRAAAAGSLACLKPGAQPSIPGAEEVDEALADRRRAS
jgi:ribokinase